MGVPVVPAGECGVDADSGNGAGGGGALALSDCGGRAGNVSARHTVGTAASLAAAPMTHTHACCDAARSSGADDGGVAAPTPLPLPLPPRRRRRVLVRSSARVLLSGLGADELLGGYARHRSAWAVGGLPRLAAELELDVRRLWQRNLGRDDRVVSECGRELRTPFLDEAVTCTLRALPLPALLDLSLPYGVGDKRALRVAAHLLGLHRASALVKRAIHFGSRIAQQSNRRAFGSNSKGDGAAPFAFEFAGAEDDATGDVTT